VEACITTPHEAAELEGLCEKMDPNVLFLKMNKHFVPFVKRKKRVNFAPWLLSQNPISDIQWKMELKDFCDCFFFHL
jgi:hypothetical protein